jgi:2-oxoglutarate ferredoxin oxidoreductase subunit beta
VNVNIILFNNRIYGLTKGQYSPTSVRGQKTKSTPMGSVEVGLNPISVAIAAEATFVARAVDVQTKHLGEVLQQAVAHRGVSFVEVLQNCNIFNDKAWEYLTAPEIRDDRQLMLIDGEPMVFGKQKDKGIRINGSLPEVVSLDEVPVDDILVHDARLGTSHLAYMLSRMDYPDHPVPMGVFRAVEEPTYAESVMEQVEQAVAKKGRGSLEGLFSAAETWTVGPRNGASGNGARARG